MESLEHNTANISPPNGNKMLIFGKYITQKISDDFNFGQK